VKILARLFGFIFLATGCTSKPAGDLQIGPQISAHKNQNDNRDMSDSKNSSLQGRVVYIEIYAYPQLLEGGDIFSGGPFLLALEREKISIDSIVHPSNGEQQ